jgi:hypothetical protein
MSRVFEEAGYDVVSFDKYNRGYGGVCDFFDIKEKYANLVTNPPFSIAEDVLAHALELAQNKICLLLRLAFLESQRRYQKFYQLNPPSRVLVFSERLSIYPKNYEIKAGGTTSYAWFCWDVLDPLRGKTSLEWIAPGAKGLDQPNAMPAFDDNGVILLGDEIIEDDPIIWSEEPSTGD